MLRKFIQLAVVLASAITLSACASTEGVAESAMDANLEYERNQNQMLLLNVVRASLRRPPVYHSLQSVVGSVRPNADLTLAVPFGVRVATANTATLGFKGNEGPKVTTAPLDTQEFVQGILAPIKTGTIDFYVQQGYPKALLYNLFFSRIEVRRKGKHAPIVVTNYPTEDKEVDRFQMLIDRLIELHFTTETVAGHPAQFGPALTRSETNSLAATAAAAAAGLTVSEEKTCLKKTKKGTCKTWSGTSYKVMKPSSAQTPRFCFRAQEMGEPRTCASEGETLSLKWKHIRSVFVDQLAPCTKDEPCIANRAEANSARALLCTSNGICGEDDEVELSFVVRSTDAIIYYLGELARRRLFPDQLESRTVGYHRDPRGGLAPCKLVGKEKDTWSDTDCQAIFWVDQDVSSSHNDVVSVDYEGSRFSVPGKMPSTKAKAHPGERSSQVLGIVTQLLALNKSAKDQPSTSILNVVNP